MLKQLYQWIGTQTHTPYASGLLSVCSFLESIIFPPVVPLLILFCLENRKRAFWYATLTILFSVLGGAFVYYLGFALWHSWGSKLVTIITTPNTFNYLVGQYQRYQTWAIVVGSFSPLPFKVIGLTAGFCKLSFSSFVFCSLIGRGIRYYLVAAVIWYWGEFIKVFIDRWFYQLVILFSLLVALGCFALYIYH